MSQNDFQAMLNYGVAAAKKGDKGAARPLLQKATEIDPHNELGWLWLAGVAESPQEAVACLQRILKLNPANKQAYQGLEWFQSRAARSLREYPICPIMRPEWNERCSACQAAFTLDDVDALLHNSQTACERLKEIIHPNGQADEADFNTLYRVGLAHLNLKQIDEGIQYLQAALRLQPQDQELQAQVEFLSQRWTAALAAVAAKAIAAKNEAKEQLTQETILVVDDSPTVRRLVTMTLEKHSYRVIPAADGIEAMSIINDERPDLILLDITMPRMDGYQLCKLIKGNRQTQHIPVIMLSGKDGFFDKVRGRMAGSTEYITKPFKSDMLVQVVKQHSNHHSH